VNNGAPTAQSYKEACLATDNTRLAAILMVFGAALRLKCPLEWVDVHQSRESFIRHQEDPANPEFQPKPRVTFNFHSESIPAREIIDAFQADYVVLNAEFEDTLVSLPQDVKNAIRDAVSILLVRACHETLLKREFLVKQLKRVPENAKWDHIQEGHRCVRIGKISSQELRAELLSKL